MFVVQLRWEVQAWSSGKQHALDGLNRTAVCTLAKYAGLITVMTARCDAWTSYYLNPLRITSVCIPLAIGQGSAISGVNPSKMCLCIKFDSLNVSLTIECSLCLLMPDCSRTLQQPPVHASHMVARHGSGHCKESSSRL